MHATQQAFLADICREPERDDLRLIFADWLEDEGEWQRAAYIRTRVEWDTLPECGHDWLLRPGGWKCHTCRRKDELFSAWTNEDGFPPWELLLPKWMKLPGVKSLDVSMSRGFPSHVTLSEADFLQHAEAIFRVAPIEGVTLSDREPYPSPLYDGKGGYKYGWCDSKRLDDARSHIGKLLWSLLPETDRVPDMGRHFKFYRTREAALDALSVACVRLGRQRAALPPLGA